MSDDSKTAIVLFNMGGPDSLKSVKPFLFNIFNDPNILSLPFGRFLRRPLARFISLRRSKKAQERYAVIGGKSPILEWTAKQAEGLQRELESYGNFEVFVAMRYWRPFIEEVVLQIDKDTFERILLIPLYPHYSIVTTGSSFNEWERVCKRHLITFPNIRNIYGYADWQPYIDSLEEQIRDALKEFSHKSGGQVHLLFSAHSVPQSVIEYGDPYTTQTLTTVNRVMQRFPEYAHHLSYQSKVGGKKWLEPSTADTVAELGRKGIKKMLVIPVSFVSDNVETLYDLNLILREDAEKAGIEEFRVMHALNDAPAFIRALTELVEEEMRIWNRRPVKSH